MKFLKHYKVLSSTQQILLLFVIAIVITSVVMLTFGYKIGHKQGVRSTTILDEQGEDQAQANTIKVASLKQQLDSAVQERDISLSNLETLREQNNQLQVKNRQTEQLNDLLLDVVAREGGIPLRVLAVEVVQFPERTYEYRFDVAMLDKSGDSIQIMPKLTLLNSTNISTVPFKSSTYTVKGITHISGRFVMPKNFEPKQMKIELYANGGKDSVEQLYDWKVGKPVAVAENKSTGKHLIGTN